MFYMTSIYKKKRLFQYKQLGNRVEIAILVLKNKSKIYRGYHIYLNYSIHSFFKIVYLINLIL